MDSLEKSISYTNFYEATIDDNLNMMSNAIDERKLDIFRVFQRYSNSWNNHRKSFREIRNQRNTNGLKPSATNCTMDNESYQSQLFRHLFPTDWESLRFSRIFGKP